MIEVVEVTQPNCQKCAHVWRVLNRLKERNPTLRIYKVAVEQIGRKIIAQYQIRFVPFLMIYLEGELKSVHKMGFTENMIKFAIEQATGVEIK